jgi:hypothetical protein
MDAAGGEIEANVEFVINRGRAFHPKDTLNQWSFDGF